MEDGEPLILSSKAARRLRLLRNQGVDLSPRLLHAYDQDAWDAPSAGGAPPPPPPEVRLAAAVLSAPLEARCNWDGLATRDVQSELAVTVATLKRLKLAAGSLVEVRNAAQPDEQPHAARVLALEPGSKGCGGKPGGEAAFLAPSLAHNLGLRLHLQPHLRNAVGGDGIEPEAPPEAHVEAVIIRPYSCSWAAAGRAPADGSQPAANAQGAYAILAVPVARDVHIQVVRQPEQRPMLGAQHSGKAAPGAGGQPEDADDSDMIVEALQQHLASTLQLVCEGDVLAAPKPTSDPALELLANLLPPVDEHSPRAAAGGAEQQLFYFKITRLLPSGEGPMAISAASTAVQLVGTCSNSLPVGLAEYLRAPPAAAPGEEPGRSAMAAGEQPGTTFLLPTWKRVAELLAVAMHPSAADVRFRLALLIHGPGGSGRRSAVATAAERLGCHVVTFSCHDISQAGAPEKNTLESLQAAFEAATEYQPTVLVLTDLEALWKGGSPAFLAKVGSILAEGIESGLRATPSGRRRAPAGCASYRRDPVVVVALAEAAEDVPMPLRSCFTHDLHVGAPDYGTRRKLLQSMLSGAAPSLGAHVLDECALHTAGLLPRELKAVAADACAACAIESLSPTGILSGSSSADDGVACSALPEDASGAPSGRVTEKHLQTALVQVRARLATDIGAPRIPSVRWEDVGGLEDVKRCILDTVQLPMKHPELFASGLRRRSGLLLYGPPGTGKTLLAKAVATECSIAFLSVKGPELINMYVGESERQIREVFARARRARPCVVFFDELDSLAPARGKGSDSGGVMDRVVSQLLAEIDGIQGGAGSSDLFIIGATNRPDLLDPALLRPGRLDKLLYVGIAGDVQSRLSVLRALTRKFQLAEDVDLHVVAARCPARFTGADMYALCSDAWMAALKRQMGSLATLDAADGAASQPASADGAAEIDVSQEDFLLALLRLKPSLGEEEVKRYDDLHAQYEQRQSR